MTTDITPKYKIIPISMSVFLEDDGLGARIGGVGGLGGKPVTEVNNASIKAENAINDDYNVITDLINARLDTSAKKILGDFTFGASGAIKMITDADNGLWFSPTGILAKKSGANTLTVTNEGDITLVGTITAVAGSIGGWDLSANAIYFDGATDVLSAGMAPADYPFYAGKKYADRASAPFRVTPAGALVATGATISGAITITGGSGIGNLSDAGNLAVLDVVGASNCNTTIISGGKIITGLLTASNIQTGSLTGITVTSTDGGNNRIVLDSGDLIRIYDNGNQVGGLKGTSGLTASGHNYSHFALESAYGGTGFDTGGSAGSFTNSTMSAEYSTYVAAISVECTPSSATINTRGNFIPMVNNSYGIGNSSYKYKDLYLSGNIVVGGTVDGVDIAAHDGGNVYTYHTGVPTQYTDSNARSAIGGVLASDGDVLANFIPSIDNSRDLGNSSRNWNDVYFDTWKKGATTYLDASTTLDCYVDFLPSANNSKDLGSPSYNWNALNIRYIRTTSQVQVDQDIWEASTYSFLVSNNGGTAKAGFGYADGWETYSEYTEIEKVASEYNNLTEAKAKKIILSYIKEEAIMKVDATEKDPGRFMCDTKAKRSVSIKKYRDRILNKDWTNKVNLAYKQKRFSVLDKGTVLAFSDNGAIPTKERGQTNIMGVISKSPCIIAHAEDEGINVTKFGHTSAKVKGLCSAGDILWTSNEEGCLEKAINPVAGQIVARARESKNTEEIGIIEVDLTL